jgi:putative ABC transport system ATP-binding protein
MIIAQDLTKTYPLGQSTVEALRGVSLTIESGEFVAIAGASGSGKSTLLNILGTIEKPTSGRVTLDNVDLASLSPDQGADLRATRLGFIFQTFNLLPVLTAYENVEYALGLQKLSAKELAPRVRSALSDVGLSAQENQRPAQLSGGQRQRVAIARALAGNPSLILADEPTANLDHRTGLDIIDLMKSLQKQRETTLLIATHDPKVIERADRVIHIEDGKIVNS